MYKHLTIQCKMLLLLVFFVSKNVFGVVNIDRSRVVFRPGELSVSISLHNSKDKPVLVQLWTDDGNLYSTPDKTKTPIITNPPVFKMKPGEIRNVRLILLSSQSLHSDRENIFWLNIYQIPPQTNDIMKERNKLILPLKLRVKVFIRPEKLSDINFSDYSKIVFRKIDDNKVRIENPTKWFITIPAVSISDDKLDQLMLKPLSETVIKTKHLSSNAGNVRYSIIDDNGVTHFLDAPLN